MKTTIVKRIAKGGFTRKNKGCILLPDFWIGLEVVVIDKKQFNNLYNNANKQGLKIRKIEKILKG